MVAPYRSRTSTGSVAARTLDGRVRLSPGPKAMVLEIPDRARLSVTSSFATIDRVVPRRLRRGTRRKQQQFRLGELGLVAARAHPGCGVGFWLEERPGVVRRIFGLRGAEGFDESVMAAWSELDELVCLLESSLGRARSETVDDAVELGRGGHRVLLIDRGDHMSLYARPVFRERPRLILEVGSTGDISLPRQRKKTTARCERSRFDVVSSSERLCFSAGGIQTASVFLPWIAEEDRAELARRFGELVERADLPDQAGIDTT